MWLKYSHMLNSNDFYSLFASTYQEYADMRKEYLDAVDAFVLREADHRAKSLVDVGAGDGRRALHIANELGINDITLIDNSPGMFSLVPTDQKVHLLCKDITDSSIAESIRADVVLWLWNVLGHIPEPGLLSTLTNIRTLTREGGVVFVDVNNRCNISQYGLVAARNYIRDIFLRSGGNFVLTIETESGNVTTNVHIFSKREIEAAFRMAGFKIEKRAYIDYKTGALKRTQFQGQLVYKLRKV